MRPKFYLLDSDSKATLSSLYAFMQGGSKKINNITESENNERLVGNIPGLVFGSLHRDYRVNHSMLALCTEPHKPVSDTLTEHVRTHLLKQDVMRKKYNEMNAFGKSLVTTLQSALSGNIDCDGNERVQRWDQSFVPPLTLYGSLAKAVLKYVSRLNDWRRKWQHQHHRGWCCGLFQSFGTGVIS